MSANKIYAHITKSAKTSYTPSDPSGYFYMFTGGYGFENGTISSRPVGDDQGPAGEVALAAGDSSWTIEVKDDTGEGFKIVQWNLSGDGDIPGVSYDPRPDSDVSATKKLRINASNVPEHHHGDYAGYFITLENKRGDRIKLDPRLYDVR